MVWYCVIVAVLLGVGMNAFWRILDKVFPVKDTVDTTHLRPRYIVKELNDLWIDH